MTEVGRVRLKDGRELLLRLAIDDDATAIAHEHPLPRDGDMPESLLRNYYLAKALLYMRAPGAGVMTGWIEGRLAGFIFHCADLNGLRAFSRKPGTAAWMAAQALSGRFGYSPSFWLGCAKWAGQHFRQPGQYESGEQVPSEYAEIPAWVGTVHAVEDFRRLGVATALLDATEQHLSSLGANNVALWAASDNTPARLLYERQGYVAVGEFARVDEQCVLMVKDLREEEGPREAQQVRAQSVSPGRAVVTDAAERVGLHVVRALGRAGIGVVATEISDRAAICPGFSSCYTQQSELLPLWERPAEEWVERLLVIGREGDVLVPTCYNSLARAVLHWERLSSVYRALLPSREALQTANDKWSLYQFALDLGVRAPETWRPEDQDELDRLAEQLEYPVILKFRSDDGVFLRPSQRYVRAEAPETLREAWRRFHATQPHPIIQRYIAGDGYGFEALYDSDGAAVATFQHRRIVECPPEGGPSALCESVRVDELRALGTLLLDRLNWRGVAMVEFRRCARTGEFYLLEVNPRFWGSLPLSEAAGVNFPELYYHSARGEAVKAEDYRIGVRSRLLPTYIISSAMSARRGREGFMRGCRQIMGLLDPRVHEGLMTLDDPRGSLAYLRRSLREI